MDPNIPILMITLQVPVTADTNVDEILSAIGERVSQALADVRDKQSAGADPEAVPQAEFNASVIHEIEETFSDVTRDDVLARLGYSAAA